MHAHDGVCTALVHELTVLDCDMTSSRRSTFAFLAHAQLDLTRLFGFVVLYENLNRRAKGSRRSIYPLQHAVARMSPVVLVLLKSLVHTVPAFFAINGFVCFALQEQNSASLVWMVSVSRSMLLR